MHSAVVTNTASMYCGPVFSKRPLLPGEIFTVKLDELSTLRRKSMYIGVTNIKPDSNLWGSLETWSHHTFNNVFSSNSCEVFHVQTSDVSKWVDNGTIKYWTGAETQNLAAGSKIGIAYFCDDAGQLKVRLITTNAKAEYAVLAVANNISKDKPVYVLIYGRFKKMTACRIRKQQPHRLKTLCRITIRRSKLDCSLLPKSLMHYMMNK